MACFYDSLFHQCNLSFVSPNICLSFEWASAKAMNRTKKMKLPKCGHSDRIFLSFHSLCILFVCFFSELFRFFTIDRFFHKISTQTHSANKMMILFENPMKCSLLIFVFSSCKLNFRMGASRLFLVYDQTAQHIYFFLRILDCFSTCLQYAN